MAAKWKLHMQTLTILSLKTMKSFFACKRVCVRGSATTKDDKNENILLDAKSRSQPTCIEIYIKSS